MSNLHDIRNEILRLESIVSLLEDNSEDFKREQLIEDARKILSVFDKYLENFE